MGDFSMSSTSDTSGTSGTTPESSAPARRETLNESRVWHVYARRKFEEPLHEIGNVMADDVELAKVYARSIYDEFTWIEMVIVPRDSIVTVFET
jgi:hypothetical protein